MKNNTITEQTSQSLFLFENILDSEKLLQYPKIEKLVKCFYGVPNISIYQTARVDDFHTLISDKTYSSLLKMDESGGAMIYPLKVRFEELAIENQCSEYSGPLNVLILPPDNDEGPLLVLTCQWKNSLFRNDYFVVGVLGYREYLEKMIEKL